MCLMSDSTRSFRISASAGAVNVFEPTAYVTTGESEPFFCTDGGSRSDGMNTRAVSTRRCTSIAAKSRFVPCWNWTTTTPTPSCAVALVLDRLDDQPLDLGRGGSRVACDHDDDREVDVGLGIFPERHVRDRPVRRESDEEHRDDDRAHDRKPRQPHKMRTVLSSVAGNYEPELPSVSPDLLISPLMAGRLLGGPTRANKKAGRRERGRPSKWCARLDLNQHALTGANPSS